MLPANVSFSSRPYTEQASRAIPHMYETETWTRSSLRTGLERFPEDCREYETTLYRSPVIHVIINVAGALEGAGGKKYEWNNKSASRGKSLSFRAPVEEMPRVRKHAEKVPKEEEPGELEKE